MKSTLEKFISAKEATKLLGITSASLYSYVSRNKIRSIKDPSNKKSHLYNYEDIVKLLEKKKTEGAETIAQQTLLWGLPVLESSITLIKNNMLYYRGIPITSLVNISSFEQVASLIWTGDLNQCSELFLNIESSSKIGQISNSLNDIQGFLLGIEKNDLQSLVSDNMTILGSKILLTIITAITQSKIPEPIAIKLSKFYCPNEKHASELINTALILIADHELNASSFTARVVASTGANLYQVLIAALSALSGYKHGSSALKLEIMVKELTENLAIEKNLRKRLSRGETIVGFGHTLYPEGDIRAKILFQQIEKYYNETKQYQLLKAIMKKCSEITGKEPNIDFALFTLATVLNQGSEFAIFLFALGRIAGWIGQAIEEYQENRLIRPRAKYIGPNPIVTSNHSFESKQ